MAQRTTFIPFNSLEEESDGQTYFDGPLARSEFDLSEGPFLRFQAYRKAWDKCLGRIKDVIHSLQQPVVDDIVNTIHNAYINLPEDIVLPSSELLAVIVSSPDRTYVHDCIARTAAIICEDLNTISQNNLEKEEISPVFISKISENDCQNVTSLMKALIGGFISQPLGNKKISKIKPSLSLASYDIHVLKAWYQAAQVHFGKRIPALIVMIQDLHIIDPISLRDLFEICSCHVPFIPLVFLLGASDPTHLQSVLPRSTLAGLHLETYVIAFDKIALEKVIKETFFSLNFVPEVMIGPAGFEMIFQEFKRHNSTMDAMLSTLQLLHMQQFYNPLAFIADVAHDAVLYNSLDCPSEEWRPFFQMLRQRCIPSFVANRASSDHSEWSELTPQDIIENVIRARRTFHDRMTQLKVAIHVLDTILIFVRRQKHKPIDMPFDSLGLEALRGSLGGTHARNVCNLARQLKLTEAQALLEELFHFLHNMPSSARVLESKLKQELVVAKNELDEEKLYRFLEFLTNHFEKILVPLDDITCLDVWWTGEIRAPNSPLNPNPHISIVTSLLEPQEYLGWTESTKTEVSRDSASLPDACVLFRRYVESGKLINIYDWYDSFIMAVENRNSEGDIERMEVDDTPHKGKGKDKMTSLPNIKRTGQGGKQDEGRRKEEVQARFMRSMHELGFVGFWKHTGRKLDHVVKTVHDVLD